LGTGENWKIWRDYPDLLIIINKQENIPHELRSTNMYQTQKPTPSNTEHCFFSRNEFSSPEIDQFIDFIIEYVENTKYEGANGWLRILNCYSWQTTQGLEAAIQQRIQFHNLVKNAYDTITCDSQNIQRKVCEQIAAWGNMSIKPCENPEIIKKSLNYLSGIKYADSIDLDQVFFGQYQYNGKIVSRVSFLSKLYYFYDPENWTIFDSRVGFILYQISNSFKDKNPAASSQIHPQINFPVPENLQNRSNPEYNSSNSPQLWNDRFAAIWFIRASFLFKLIAKKLNERNDIGKPSCGIYASGKWELYHIEMVLFTLGK
jgi:hypothetical protein